MIPLAFSKGCSSIPRWIWIKEGLGRARETGEEVVEGERWEGPMDTDVKVAGEGMQVDRELSRSRKQQFLPAHLTESHVLPLFLKNVFY